MRKLLPVVVVLILLSAVILFLVFAGDKEIIENKISSLLKPDTESWDSWKAGLLKRGLILDSVSFSVTIIEEIKIDGVHVGAVAKTEIVAFCKDESGNNKRYISVRTVAYEIYNEEIISYIFLDIEETIKTGWGDKTKK